VLTCFQSCHFDKNLFTYTFGISLYKLRLLWIGWSLRDCSGRGGEGRGGGEKKALSEFYDEIL